MQTDTTMIVSTAIGNVDVRIDSDCGTEAHIMALLVYTAHEPEKPNSNV